MRRGIAQLLPICLMLLTSNGASIAQENPAGAQKTTPPAQAKPAADSQEAKAAAKAEGAKRRAEAKAHLEERRGEAQQKRVLAQEKRMAAHEERVAAQIAREQKRIVERALQQVRQAEGTFKLLGSRVGMGKVVKGAPYSATAITEHTQTLSDGNQIIQKNEAAYYRDSEGRTRIDQKLKTIGKWTAPGDPAQVITIFDPVTGNHYSLNSKTRIALLDARGPQKPSNPMPKPNPQAKPQPIGPVTKSTEQDQHSVAKEGSDRKKKESLGNRVIEGISAEGSRQTVTIPAGEIGNVAPIEITDESWYSPELQLPVMTRHHDPRSGDTTYRLTNINRSEPARSLFEVPSDYQIVDRKAPRVPTTPELHRPPELPKLPKQPATPEVPKKPEDNL